MKKKQLFHIDHDLVVNNYEPFDPFSDLFFIPPKDNQKSNENDLQQFQSSLCLFLHLKNVEK